MSKNIACLIYCWILKDGLTHFNTFTFENSSSPGIPGDSNLITIEMSKEGGDRIHHFFRVYLK